MWKVKQYCHWRQYRCALQKETHIFLRTDKPKQKTLRKEPPNQRIFLRDLRTEIRHPLDRCHPRSISRCHPRSFSSAGALVLKKGCQTSRHLAAARRASQRQLLDIGDGPNGAGGWENRKTLAENANGDAEEGKKRREKSERRWREKTLAGSRRTTTVSATGNHPENTPNPDGPDKTNPRHRESSRTHNPQGKTHPVLKPKKTCRNSGARYWPRARSSPSL
jgi:hypothetical protein